MALKPDDYQLSMAISPRAKGKGDDPPELRSLLVNRLTDTEKAVLRRPRRQLRGEQLNLYCEPCRRWTTMEPLEEVRCPKCNRLYRLEFAVYEEVE